MRYWWGHLGRRFIQRCLCPVSGRGPGPVKGSWVRSLGRVLVSSRITDRMVPSESELRMGSCFSCGHLGVESEMVPMSENRTTVLRLVV